MDTSAKNWIYMCSLRQRLAVSYSLLDFLPVVACLAGIVLIASNRSAGSVTFHGHSGIAFTPQATAFGQDSWYTEV